MSAAAPVLERVVVVGASLAGLRGAEALRQEGYAGSLTVVGDEPGEPYDRPPLSKAVLTGRTPPGGSVLPRLVETDAEWITGVAATGLDPRRQVVTLADGRELGYDRVLIATGTRPRPWPDAEQAGLDGVLSVHTPQDARTLRARLVERPRRVLVVGGGFIGSEVASACRELDLEVTLVEHGAGPLVGALGGAVGPLTSRLQREHGVDLRCGTAVTSLEGEGGRLVGARLSDGDRVAADVAVIALGAVRNVEWLAGSGLAVDARGVACDAACRVFDAAGATTDDVFVAGDVARWPHPLYDGHLVVVEHWSNAVDQARTAAHNMVCAPALRRPHDSLPRFWSNQFGLNIKSVGVISTADEVVVTQGSPHPQGPTGSIRCVAAYGSRGRLVAALAVNEPRALEAYEALIRARAPFPPDLRASNGPQGPQEMDVVPARFPSHAAFTHSPTAAATGSGPTSPEDPSCPDGAPHRGPDPRTPPSRRPL